MLPFEVAVLLASATVSLTLVALGRVTLRIPLGTALGAALVLTFWKVSIEVRHWQMWPTLLALIVLVVVFLFRPSSKLWVRSIASSALVLLAASLAASAVLPMFQVPPSTGPYRVGTVTLHLVDNRRLENYSKDPKARRELNVQLWYPTSASRGVRAPYRRVAETTFLSRYQSAIATEALDNAPIATPRGANPIVLFNPAWNGLRTQDTFEMVELASYGFVVVSVDHTFNAIRTAFPDGRVITAQSGDLDDFTRESPEVLFARGTAELQTQAADDSFVLDTLQQWNQDPTSPYHGKFDTSRVGVMGHSFGGAVAIQTAIVDSRVRSAINMDGWVFGDFITSGLNKPLLQMIDDEPFPTAADVASADPTVHGEACFNGLFLVSLQSSFQKNGGELLRFHGAKHMDFSDRPLFSPIPKLTSSGMKNWPALASEIRLSTVHFFQRTLLDQAVQNDSNLMAGQVPVAFSEWTPGESRAPLFSGSLESCGIRSSESNSLVQKTR